MSYSWRIPLTESKRKKILERVAENSGGKVHFGRAALDLADDPRTSEIIQKTDANSCLDAWEVALDAWSCQNPALEDYNPESDINGFLDTSTLKQVRASERDGNEPALNPNHVSPEKLPASVNEYIPVLAAIVRYKSSEEHYYKVYREEIVDIVKEYCGNSPYFLGNNSNHVDAPGKIADLYYTLSGVHYTKMEGFEGRIEWHYSSIISAVERLEKRNVEDVFLPETEGRMQGFKRAIHERLKKVRQSIEEYNICENISKQELDRFEKRFESALASFDPAETNQEA